MARPREFDESEALERARAAFWSHGVAATSISDVSNATGLSVGSIYKAFNSKDELCALTLTDYLERARTDIAATVSNAKTPIDGIRAWLGTVVDAASDTSPTCGCYAVNLATERAQSDERIRKLLAEQDAHLRAIIGAAVADASQSGDINGDPQAVTQLLLTTVNGLQVEARKGISRADAQLIIDTLLTTLGVKV